MTDPTESSSAPPVPSAPSVPSAQQADSSDADFSRKLQQRHIRMMQVTMRILTQLIATLTDEQTRTWRDPDDGQKAWSVLEVLCHLRDFDAIFQQRARLILAREVPDLPAFDHEYMAVQREYNRQLPQVVLGAMADSRARFIELFQALTPDQWQRSGIHPESGRFTLTDALLQVAGHDITHVEQITRTIAAHRAARTVDEVTAQPIDNGVPPTSMPPMPSGDIADTSTMDTQPIEVID